MESVFDLLNKYIDGERIGFCVEEEQSKSNAKYCNWVIQVCQHLLQILNLLLTSVGNEKKPPVNTDFRRVTDGLSAPGKQFVRNSRDGLRPSKINDDTYRGLLTFGNYRRPLPMAATLRKLQSAFT